MHLKTTTSHHYYPFGMLMPTRTWDAESSYRFGFNTQERVDEISGKGNHNTALFWEYDTRLGRRWNLDPFVNPVESPYACLNLNPILRTDVLGDDPRPGELKRKTKKYDRRLERYLRRDPTGTVASFESINRRRKFMYVHDDQNYDIRGDHASYFKMSEIKAQERITRSIPPVPLTPQGTYAIDLTHQGFIYDASAGNGSANISVTGTGTGTGSVTLQAFQVGNNPPTTSEIDFNTPIGTVTINKNSAGTANGVLNMTIIPPVTGSQFVIINRANINVRNGTLNVTGTPNITVVAPIPMPKRYEVVRQGNKKGGNNPNRLNSSTIKQLFKPI